jgi:L-2-hydroxyglutarate oxidase
MWQARRGGVDETELARLNALHERGQQNGCAGLRLLSPEQMREIERTRAGSLRCTCRRKGIVDYHKVCGVLRQEISARGGRVRHRRQGHTPAIAVERLAGAIHGRRFETDFLVNCAGLHCDRVGKLAGEKKREVRIVPFRGRILQNQV